MRGLCLGLGLSLSAVACTVQAQGAGCDDLRGRPIHFAVDWQTEVKPILNDTLGGRCLNCHNGYPDFSDVGFDAIYKIVNEFAIPGRPQQSRLFQKVNCEIPATGGARMPRDSTPLSLQEQELIHDWIAQGALGEDTDFFAIPREFVFRDGIEGLR